MSSEDGGFAGGNSRPDPEKGNAFDSTEPSDRLYEVYTGPGFARDNTRSRVMPDPNVQTSYAIDSDDPAMPGWVSNDLESLVPLRRSAKSGFANERPQREGALGVYELKLGVRVVVHDEIAGTHEVWTIRSRPKFDGQYSFYVEAERESDREHRKLPLANIGVMRYVVSDVWLATSYTTLAPPAPKRQKLFIDLSWNDSMEFFKNLGASLRSLVEQGKAGDFEVSVPPTVRDKVPPQVVDRYKIAGIVAYLVHD